MRLSRFAIIFLAVATAFNVYAQDQSAPKADSAKAQSAPAQAPSDAKPAAGPAVDVAKVTDSTFESPYFKFTYELPRGWKALDDASRTAANQQAIQEDVARSKMSMSATKKASAKNPPPSGSAAHPPVGPERYSLMAAGPNGLDSLASPSLPRINIWAHRRIPPLDKAMDHAQLLVSGKHNEILVRPQELDIEGHPFVRVQLANAAGNYQARYITVMGDFLVGFDFLAQSEKEMVEIANMIKSIRFE